MSDEAPRNPRMEAFERLGGRYEVRVLEPSPPAGPATDDPVSPDGVPEGRMLVSPVTNGDVLWDDLAHDDEELGEWCAERWLGYYQRLGDPPPGHDEARRGLHAIALHVLGPARRRVEGRLALRWVRGGFGTPFFAGDVQVRVDGDALVVQSGGRIRRCALRTLADAAELVAEEVTGALDAPDARVLEIDPAASRHVGEVLGFGCSVLEQLRAELDPSLSPSLVEIDPHRFEVVLVAGSARCAVSPGDDRHPLPHMKVTAPAGKPTAELSWQHLCDAGDQRAAALSFLRATLGELRAA